VGELGFSPIKRAEGKHQELLTFAAGPSESEASAAFSITHVGSTDTLVPTLATSVSEQAQTRGGRPVQAILDGKAQFKDNLTTAGEVTETVGASMIYGGVLSDNSDMAGAGLVVGAIGIFASKIAEAAKPTADARYWDNLPDSIHFATFERPNEAWEASMQLMGSGRTGHAELLDDQSSSCSVVWARSTSAAQLTASAPNAELTPREAKRLAKRFGEQDRAFRAELLASSF
jgi:hypothetical protein